MMTPARTASPRPPPASPPPTTSTPTLNGTGSYRRAEEIFNAASDGRTLHKLRHNRLTHLAEAGEDVTKIKAKSRHGSLRGLECYSNPSNEQQPRLTDRHDPNRRRL